MRTKALLLAAAFVAAGIASHAQVYSVNAVGYVNKTLVPGFQLVSNPLTAADNTIGKLFMNFQGGVRDGTTVYRFNNGTWETASFDVFAGEYGGDAVARVILPGDGVFVFLPNPGAGEAANKTLTFVGEVPQGPTSTAIPRGFSIKASVVPQAIAPDQAANTGGAPGSAALPAADGDTFYQYLPSAKNYDAITYDQFGGWSKPLPVLPPGEAFFYFRLGNATTWNRTFSVNNPS